MKRSIAIISDHASPLASLGGVDSGGQNVYVAQVASQLARNGHHVDVYTRRENASQPTVVHWKTRVRVIHVDAGPACPVPKEALLHHMPEFTAWMQAFIAKHRLAYDLCHANFWMSGLVACDLKRTLGLPFVITFHALGKVRRKHQGSEDKFPEERLAYERQIVREADSIVAECPQDEADLIELYEANPHKLVMIPCGFDPREMWPVMKWFARWKLGLRQDEFILLQLGRMVPRKGVDNAIRGFARFIKEHGHGHHGRLVIVGGESDEPDPLLTPEIGRLGAIAEQEGVADRVHFTGRQTRQTLRYYYSAADVFVTTPWYEPFGITPLEAMACGTAVVASNVGGLKFTVRDGETGYLVPADNPERLAHKLAYLYHHPRMLKAFSRRGRRRVLKFFKWSRITRLLEEVYEEVCQAAPAPQRNRQELILLGGKPSSSLLSS